MFTKTAVSVVALAAAALGQTLVNGGFDLDAQNDSPPAGWQTSDPVNNLVDGVFYQAASAPFSWIFGSTSPSTLSQSVAGVVPGECYAITFYAGLENNPNADTTNTGLSVSFGSVQDQTVPITTYPALVAPSTNFVLNTVYALGTNDPTLTFTGFADYYINLDNVAIANAGSLNPCLGASPQGRARTRRNKRHGHQAQW